MFIVDYLVLTSQIFDKELIFKLFSLLLERNFHQCFVNEALRSFSMFVVMQILLARSFDPQIFVHSFLPILVSVRTASCAGRD